MVIEMKLNPTPFELMKSGKKTIEVRLCDKKRSSLRPGDEIIFTNTDGSGETLKVSVLSLRRFDSFLDLYHYYPLMRLGCEEMSMERLLENTYKIYSEEEELRYGALAIEVMRVLT